MREPTPLPDETTVPGPEPSAEERRAADAADLRGALGWLVFGLAVVVLSWRMDRLEAQHINPYTVPGLLPGLLGGVMVLLGVLMALRSWQRGARFSGGPRLAMDRAVAKRVGLVIAVIVIYSVVLLGHGLPFWLASALFVVASILLLQAPQRAAAGRGVSAKDVLFASAVGIGSGVVITLVFQNVFLVRLP